MKRVREPKRSAVSLLPENWAQVRWYWAQLELRESRQNLLGAFRHAQIMLEPGTVETASWRCLDDEWNETGCTIIYRVQCFFYHNLRVSGLQGSALCRKGNKMDWTTTISGSDPCRWWVCFSDEDTEYQAIRAKYMGDALRDRVSCRVIRGK